MKRIKSNGIANQNANKKTKFIVKTNKTISKKKLTHIQNRRVANKKLSLNQMEIILSMICGHVFKHIHIEQQIHGDLLLMLLMTCIIEKKKQFMKKSHMNEITIWISLLFLCYAMHVCCFILLIFFSRKLKSTAACILICNRFFWYCRRADLSVARVLPNCHAHDHFEIYILSYVYKNYIFKPPP